MANVLKSDVKRITTADGNADTLAFADTLITVGSGKTLTLIGVTIASITTSTVNATVTMQKAGSGTKAHIIGKNTPVADGQAIYFPMKHVLEATDVLVGQCTADDSVDIVFSYLEQS